MREKDGGPVKSIEERAVGGGPGAVRQARAPCLFFLKPVTTALRAVAILGESPTALKTVATLVNSGSVLVEVFRPRLAKGRAGSGR